MYRAPCFIAKIQLSRNELRVPTAQVGSTHEVNAIILMQLANVPDPGTTAVFQCKTGKPNELSTYCVITVRPIVPDKVPILIISGPYSAKTMGLGPMS